MQAKGQHQPRGHGDLRRNWICHVLEGGFYMGGTAFLAPESVLPKMVQSLGGSSWIIALMPVVLPAAFACAGLFVAPRVERLDRFKPWVLTFGLLQRLPYLLTGLSLLLWDGAGRWLLPLVVLTPLLSGLLGGITVVAWMEMVTRMIPEKWRAAGWSARYVMQAVLGIGAGVAIHTLLEHFPGRHGYGWLHLATFALLTLSWLVQLPMRESPHPRQDNAGALTSTSWKTLRSLPSMLASVPSLPKLVAVRFLGTGYLMLAAFLSIHALGLTQRPESDEGHFVTWQAAGTVVGSVLAAWAGYHHGGKLPLMLSRLICVGWCLWLPLCRGFADFNAAYAVLGVGLFLDRVGDLTLTAELCPPSKRSTLQAMLSFCNVLSLLASAGLAALIWRWGALSGLSLCAAAMAALSGGILASIPEPRKLAPPPL